MNKKEEFNAIAAKYFVQIRGIHGEHTETDDGVFDISNLRRLGRSERQLVQDMIDGVHALIEAENAIAEWAKTVKDIGPSINQTSISQCLDIRLNFSN